MTTTDPAVAEPVAPAPRGRDLTYAVPSGPVWLWRDSWTEEQLDRADRSFAVQSFLRPI